MPLDSLQLPGVLGGSHGKELLAAIDLARAAGKETVRIRTGGALGVEHKLGDEPVTIADKLANTLIVEGLAAQFPDDVIVSEEDSASAAALSGVHARVWLVDPIDGTADFIKGTDGFAVMIGLVEGGRPVLGVVHQPTIERTYFASPGAGAHVADASGVRPLAASTVAHAADARLVASASHRTPDTDRLKQELGIADEQNVGSVGIKLCLIAAGARDLYVNPVPKTKAWDSCAPEAILAAVGGRLTDLFGAAIDYRELAHPRGLIASNGRVHDEVVTKLAPMFERYRSA